MKRIKFNRVYFILFLILVFGFIVRIIFNPGLGYNDEYDYISSAYEIFIVGERPTNIGALRMGIIVPIGILIKLIGVKEFIFTSFMFIISMINLILVYKVCRNVFNSTISLTATLLMAMLPIEITYSTSVLPDSIIQFYYLLTLVFFFFFLNNINNNKRYNYIPIFFSGIFCGLSYATKETGILIIIPLIIFLFIKRIKWISYSYLILGIIFVVLLELLFSQFVCDDYLARYTNQLNIVNEHGKYTSINNLHEFFIRFFITYPFQLLFPLQKSGNLFGIYYFLILILLLISFKKYILKINDLSLFLIWAGTIIVIINFAIIDINPITALIRPQARYFIPIDGCICIICAKLLYDFFYKNTIKKYAVVLSVVVLSSIFYMFILINSQSPTSNNNKYYYSKELSNYVIVNKSFEEYNNLYCSFDVRNYLNMLTEFKYKYKIKDIDPLSIHQITDKDLIIVNSSIIENLINNPFYFQSFPSEKEHLENILTNPARNFKTIYKVQKPYSIVTNLFLYVRDELKLKYFRFFEHPNAIILTKF